MPIATSSDSWKALGALLARPGAPAGQPAVERDEREVGRAGAEEEQQGAAERPGPALGDLGALEVGVEREEAEQPDRQRHEEAQPVLADAAQEREEEHAERDGDHADVEAEQRHEPVEAPARLGGEDRDGDLVLGRDAGRAHERHEVGRVLLPRVVEREALGAARADLVAGAVEVDVGVVDEHLRDRDGIGAGVADGQVDLPGAQHRALDGDLLDGRAEPLAQRVVADRQQRGQRGDDERERDECERPGGDAQTTSKNPIHPRSANSVLCAWNMKRPLCLKRISRMPRCPCTWAIVSVNSAGCRRVPVG
jgi:hypothetical protein